jgi:hypothetical protein
VRRDATAAPIAISQALLAFRFEENKMLTKTKTCALIGLDGTIVEVEVDISPGLPAFTVVGLPDAALQESRERVRAAIRNSGF